VGDFILTLPAIRLLKETIPDCELEILGYPSIAVLAVAAGYADSVRSLEHRSMALLFVPGAKLDAELEAWLKSFNLVVSYLFDPDGILRENMQRIGVKTFLNMPHRVVDGQGYAATQLAQPLQKIAFFLEDERPRIVVKDIEPFQPKRIALHPGSGGLKKNWPVEHWCRLGKELAETHELALITGEAEHERGITAAVTHAWRGMNYLHWDRLLLPELARMLPSCDWFLGHDSGTAHLAAACGLRCHLFFGPSHAETWAPRGAVICQASAGDLTSLSYEEGRCSVSNIMFL
jgi:heptosyltransferase III